MRAQVRASLDSAFPMPEEHMNRLMSQIHKLVCDDSGQDLLEYALLAALISLVAYAAVYSSGQQVNSLFSLIAGMMTNAASAAGA